MVYHMASNARYCEKVLGANVDNGENDSYMKGKRNPPHRPEATVGLKLAQQEQ